MSEKPSPNTSDPGGSLPGTICVGFVIFKEEAARFSGINTRLVIAGAYSIGANSDLGMQSPPPDRVI
jgi:hypothetical protein